MKTDSPAVRAAWSAFPVGSLSTPPAENSKAVGGPSAADGQGVCTHRFNSFEPYEVPKPLNVLVACEYSGRVREAFAARGHNAASVDLLPTEVPGRHFQGDIFEFVASSSIEWDLLIAHPPCTDLAVSGARYFPAKRADGRQAAALDFVRRLMALPIRRKAIENPVSVISSQIRKPDQIIQPWMFGHGEVKATCLWLEELPPLLPTSLVDGREAVVHRMPPGPDRWKNRSRTYLGIAAAMAAQWGAV